MESQEKEISLLSLFRYLLKRWKSIILVAVILAIGFSSLGYVSERKRLNTPLDEIQKNLTDDEIAALLKVQDMDAELKALNYYIENSVIMNMDPYNVQRASLSYFVDTKHITNYAGDTESDLTWDIMSIYVSKLNSMDWKAEALKEAGSDIDLKYFNEMVSISTSGRTFTITITYPDAEQLKVIMNVLQENIQSYKDDISSAIGTHSLTLIGNTMESSVLDRDLKAVQEDKEYQLGSLYEEVKKSKNALNEKQKTMYYGRVLSQQELSTGIISDEVPQAGISVKKFVMGGFLGGILMVAIYSVQFITQNKVRVEDNVEATLGISNLGYAELPLSKKQDFIHKKIRRAELRVTDGLSPDEQFNVILSNIKHECSGAESLYINSPEGDELSKRLSESLTKSGVSCHVVDNIMKQTESLNSNSAVVFVVRTDYSTYPQLYREINFCTMRSAKLIGTAVEI